jgi:hypothetical protein
MKNFKYQYCSKLFFLSLLGRTVRVPACAGGAQPGQYPGHGGDAPGDGADLHECRPLSPRPCLRRARLHHLCGSQLLAGRRPGKN